MTYSKASDGKFLVFDGISGVGLGHDLHLALTGLNVPATYIDAQQLTRKRWHHLRGSVVKAINKSRRKEGFYHFPKVPTRRFVEILEREAPDYVLAIGFLYRFLDPRAVLDLKRRYGFRLFLYDTDSCNFYSRRREFIFFLENELPVYDHIFSFSRVTTRFFKGVRGLKADYLPFGAVAPTVEHGSPATEDLDVLFVGSADLRRIFLLEAICDHLAVYGQRWRRNAAFMSPALKSRVHDRAVWGRELQELLGRSKIVLNITRSDFYGTETGINLRVFEALGAGCFLLTDYSDEVKDLFRVGEEIETFHSSEELRAKVRYYLANDEHRRAVAARGHERFMRDFTWTARMKELLGLAQAT